MIEMRSIAREAVKPFTTDGLFEEGYDTLLLVDRNMNNPLINSFVKWHYRHHDQVMVEPAPPEIADNPAEILCPDLRASYPNFDRVEVALLKTPNLIELFTCK